MADDPATARADGTREATEAPPATTSAAVVPGGASTVTRKAPRDAPNRSLQPQCVMYRDAAGSPAVVACPWAGRGEKRGKGKGQFMTATIFWLTNVALNSLVARFERIGGVHLAADLLGRNPEMLAAHLRSHDAYVAKVHTILQTDSDRAKFDASFVTHPTERKYGNAGVGNADGVKCLHAQVAAALSGVDAPIGAALVHHILYLRDAVRAPVGLAVDGAAPPPPPGKSPVAPLCDDAGLLLRHLADPTKWTLGDILTQTAARNVCEACEVVLSAADGGTSREGGVARSKKKRRVN